MQCKKCGKYKPRNEFYQSAKSWCKECMKKYTHDRYYYLRSGLKSKMCKVCKDVYPFVDFTRKPNGKYNIVCIHCQGKQEGRQLSIVPKPKPIANPTIKTNIKTTKKMEKNVKKGAPKVSVLTKITDRLFGKKYYANVINRRGTTSLEMSSFIFATKQEAEKHRISLEMNLSFQWVETISFRSREGYV